MADHVIRLRTAWEVAGPLAAPGGRLDFPIDWPTGSQGSIRLTRRFGRPPIDPARERLTLRIGGGRGLVATFLNGDEVERVSGTDSVAIDLPADVPPRNRLELVLDLAIAGGSRWESVNVVIGPRRASPSSGG